MPPKWLPPRGHGWGGGYAGYRAGGPRRIEEEVEKEGAISHVKIRGLAEGRSLKEGSKSGPSGCFRLGCRGDWPPWGGGAVGGRRW